MTLDYEIHDILLCNKQGTIKALIVVKIIIMSDGPLYEMDDQSVLREDSIIKLLGNAATIQEDFYDKPDKNDLP